MEISWLNDKICTRRLSLDISSLTQSSKSFSRFIEKRFDLVDLDPKLLSAKSTRANLQYNLFSYPFPKFYDFFVELKNTFISVRPNNGLRYYVKCWVNTYYKDDYISWHNHDLSPLIGETDVEDHWHGFYCVSGLGSKTTYDINGEYFDIDTEPNLMVLINDNTLMHRTYPWHDNENPRITIAFNFYPESCVIKSPLAFGNALIPID